MCGSSAKSGTALSRAPVNGSLQPRLLRNSTVRRFAPRRFAPLRLAMPGFSSRPLVPGDHALLEYLDRRRGRHPRDQRHNAFAQCAGGAFSGIGLGNSRCIALLDSRQ
jgi:hypothetical protein